MAKHQLFYLMLCFILFCTHVIAVETWKLWMCNNGNCYGGEKLDFVVVADCMLCDCTQPWLVLAFINDVTL